MKLMQVSLSVRKDLESCLHGCGGPVKLVQVRISSRKNQFMYHERSRKQFATLCRICEACSGQYKCQDNSFHHCGGHVKYMQASLSARKDVESSFHGCGRPVKFVQASISARKDQFMSTNDLESSFDHCGAPVNLVHAPFSVSKAAEGRFYHWDVVSSLCRFD